ncbi:mycothiol transferase [Actinoplanes sp. CA-054009]
MDARDILTEAFGRLPELVHTAVDGLTPEQLRHRPADQANSIGWLVWHLTRVQDDHVAEVMGADQIYATGDWAPRFGLKDAADTGYGHDAAQVAAVAPESAQALVDYYTAVHERTIGYLAGLSEADLDRVVDERWDPPVTLGVRLVSVYGDDAQHAGQAAYVRGLL